MRKTKKTRKMRKMKRIGKTRKMRKMRKINMVFAGIHFTILHVMQRGNLVIDCTLDIDPCPRAALTHLRLSLQSRALSHPTPYRGG